MEIEEMKALWSEMSDQLEQQKKLTNEIIMSMTQERYSRKFQTIFKYESIGTVFCFMLVVALLINFHKLDTWYLILCGVFTGVFMAVFPVLVLKSLNRLRKLNITDYNYKSTLLSFVKEKKKILQIQKIGMLFYIPLMPAMLLVAVKILKNKNFFTMDKSMYVYIVLSITLVLVVWITHWGYNHYKKITTAAENVLKELEK